MRDEVGVDDRAAVDAFLVSCYNNLAACYLSRAAAGQPEPGGSVEGDYKLCVQASTYGIEIAASCKALYRRARGLSEPMTATDDDVAAAITDLTEAARVEPDDKAVRALLAKLKRGRADAKAREASAFSGLFDKAELYDKKTMDAMATRRDTERRLNEPKDVARTPEDCEREQLEAQAAVDHLRERGRHEDADALEEKLKGHKQQLEQYKKSVAEQEEKARRHDPQQIDFSNPTPEQVADAKKHGIDLYDPLVAQELARLQKEKEFGGEEDGEEDSEEDGDESSSRAARREDRRRNALDDNGLKPRTRSIIFALALAIGLYRIWAMFTAASRAEAHDEM